MKILSVSNDPSIFDPKSAARARMKAYAAEIPGGELHILTRAPRDAREEQDGNLFLYPVTTPRSLIMFLLPKKVRALILAHSIDIVSAQDPFEYGSIALRALNGTSAKLYVQVHTDFLSPWFTRMPFKRAPRIRMPLLNRVRRCLANKVLPKAAGIRVVSERIKQSLADRYGSRIPEPSVIPIVVAREVPQAVPLPPNDFNFVFMAVGRLEPEKRIEDIVNALARIGYRYPHAGLMIAGEGRERARIERYARTLGLGKRVLFLGNRSDAWGLMRSAHAFIQASAYEGYGLTLIEAALARVPIITTDVGIVGEVFKGYEDVLAVPPGDPAALAAAMTRLIEDPQSRELLTRSAEAAAEKHLASIGDQPARIAADLARLMP